MTDANPERARGQRLDAPHDDLDSRVAASARVLRERLPAGVPGVAVVLGSGWSTMAQALQQPLEIPYRDLPAFPDTAVPGHGARIVAGRLGGQPVLLLCGRRHAYEGGKVDAMAGPIRTLSAAGCGVLVLTNAAGSVDPDMRPGELMLVTDHLNLVQGSPLLAERDERRFVDLRGAYDPALAECARGAARAQGIRLHEGVYAWVLGPQFETPAEIRMLQRLGAHAVGMSTVPETILARHAGLRVLGLSLLTNMACGLDERPLGHAQTLAGAALGIDAAARLLSALVPALQPVPEPALELADGEPRRADRRAPTVTDSPP
jgi:purine-nucleoside phosphorylase